MENGSSPMAVVRAFVHASRRSSHVTGFGTPKEIIERFGGKDAYVKAVRELEDALYETAS